MNVCINVFNSGGFEGAQQNRKKRETIKSVFENNELEGECPGATFVEYDECMTEEKEQVTNAPDYFQGLHMPSVDKFVLEDVARCR